MYVCMYVLHDVFWDLVHLVGSEFWEAEKTLQILKDERVFGSHDDDRIHVI